MANADISLLFGVAGEGSLSGESGRLIQEQLTQIMTELNKNPLKIKVGLDTSAEGKKSWSSQIQEKLDQLSASGKFSAQVSTLKLSTGAVSDFKKQLTAIVNTLGLSTGAEVTISPKGIGDVKNELKQVSSTASEATKSINEFKTSTSSAAKSAEGAAQSTAKGREEVIAYLTQLNVLKTVLQGVESVYRSATFGKGMLTDPSNITQVTDSVNELKRRIEEAGKIKIDNIADLERENELIKQQASEFVELVSAMQRVEAANLSANSLSAQSAEYTAQLTALKTVMDSVAATFKSAVFSKNMVVDTSAIQEITDKFIELTIRAKEAQAVSAGDAAELQSRISVVRETAKEFENLVAAKRQFEAPSTDYVAQMRELEVVLRTVKNSFDAIVSGRKGIVSESDIERARVLYSLVEETERKINTDMDAAGLQSEVSWLRQIKDELDSIVASKNQAEAPSTNYVAQLKESETILRAIKSDFDALVSGRTSIIRPEDVEQAKTLYATVEEIRRRIETSTDADKLQQEISALRDMQREFGNLIAAKKQFETPSTDYEAQLREVEAVLKTIRSDFDAIASGRVGAVKEEDIQRAKTLYSLAEEIRRSISAEVSITGLQEQIPLLREIQGEFSGLRDSIKGTGDSTSEAASKLAEFRVQMESLTAQKNAVKKSVDDLGKSAASEEEKAQIAEIAARYEQWAIKIEEVRAAKSAIPTDQRAAIEAEGAAILANIDRINAERVAREDAARAAAEAETREAASQEQKNAALRAGITLLTQMEKAERDWTAAQTGSSKQNYAGLQSDIASLKEYQRQLENGEITVEEFRKKLSELQTSFSANSNAIKSAGENMRSLSARLGNLAQKFSAWLSVSQVIMLGIRSIRRMVSATIELDDAMTQLKIVTRDTSQAYEEYLDNVSKIATRIGSAIPDLVDSTTTFARLGYSLEESTALAEFTAMLQNVGDIDVSDAQDAITAIVKAFGVSVDEIESIMDKLVITGNNFPISVSQIAEGMNNASSALAAAGNTFEQSVALLTAANTTIQNAAKSSTGLRTIAARLRSTKTELDELGEAMTDAEYGNLVAALTKYNVALTDINDEFRSTYDIVADIAAIWGDLSTMEQAALANAIAGTRQQSVFFSMVEQFQEASGAMEDMANSAGTLQESYATFMESVTAHINQFKAAFQSLSQSAFTREFLNGVIDFGTGILRVLEGITRVVNAVGGLNTVLYITAGLIATIKADSIFAWLLKIPQSIARLSNDILGIMQIFSSGFADARAAGASALASIGAGFKSVAGLATTAQLAVGAFVAVLGIALIAYNSYKRSVEETRQRNIDSANAAKDLSSEISDLTNQYIELSEAVKSDGAAKEDLLSTQNKLIDKLGLEKEALQELVEEYGNLDDAIKAATIESLQDAERDLRGGLNAYKDAVLEAAEPSLLASKSMNHIVTTWSKDNAELNRRGLDALAKAGYISSGSYSSRGMELYLPGEDDYDLSTIEGVINAYERLGEMLDIVSEEAGSENEVYDALYSAYNSCTEAIGNYEDAIGSLNSNLAQQYMLQSLIGNEIPNTKEEFDAYRQSVIDAAKESEEFVGSDADIVNAIDGVLSKQTQFAEFYATQLTQASEGTRVYSAQLTELTDVLSELKSSYDALEAAQEDMANGSGLSAETIEKLANAEENYLDYLYEENGVIKLNTDAWRENANAKMQGEMAEIQKEIDSIKEENAALEELIDTYEEKRLAALQEQDLTAYYDYYHLIDNTSAKIRENNKVIAENQNKLSIYESLFNSIAGAAGQLESTLDVFDGYTSGMEKLADLQELVSKGYTVAADKVRELAEVYPELLEAATTTANGEIRLNEEVVNSILKGKREELNGTVDAEIAKLEAKRAVLQAELAIVNEQVAAAESADEAIVTSANEAASAKMAIEQAVLSACEQAGIDEQTANQLALAAMTEDWDTFSSLAQQAMYDLDDESADAFTSVMNNFATMSQNIVNNTNEIIGAYSKMGEALSRAMQGLTTGEYSASISGGSVSGGGKDSLEGLLSDMFDSAKSDYGNGGTALDNQMDSWQKRLQEIADSYTNVGSNIDELREKQASLNRQIESVNGQISLLESLKNRSIKSFQSDSGSKSGSDSSKKEVEEYIAAIDDYREAIERLNRVQQTRSDLERRLANNKDLQAQIEVQRQLLEVYKEEQEALHNLNDLRDATIFDGANTLRQLGFDVEYDPDKNHFYVNNLEHINELVADSKGKYESLQEATNALREGTEELINSLSSLNEENQENSESWWELYYAMQEAQIAVYENIRQERENAVTLAENWLANAVSEQDISSVEQFADSIISYYKEMQETLHREADYYRSLGYTNTSDEVSKLSDLWWEYADNIAAVEQQVVDTQIAIYESARQERENAITLTENWLSNAISDRDLFGVKQYADDIVSYYKEMQETIHQEADYYRSKGYSDTSDEVSKLSDLWWEYADNITAVKQRIVDNLIDIVDTAHEAVDEIQNVLSTLKSAADEYADNGGFITVDTLQEIIKLGPEYMQYLEDENGLLVINEENINRVIAAKTQQLALENAVSYVERLRLALEEDSIENLNQLLFATTEATDATWGLVYANLALLDLDENQYQAALHNINSIRALADTTVENIGKVTGAAADAAKEAAEAAKKELESLRDELNDMKDAGDDIIKYVMDMLKHRIQQQIDALKDLKAAYADIIKLRKEALDAAKKEAEYENKVADKVKQIAKLQEKINALSLDDSRDAQAQKIKLEEELAELQKELADDQSDYAVDAQKDALDDMQKAYEKEKDAEIEALKETISSYQKLYDMAISYIEEHWNTLYDELIAWNTEYGSVLNSEITNAWDNCLAAAQRYGSFVDAMLGGIEAEIASINAQIESIDLSSSSSGRGTTSSGSSASDNVVVGNSKNYESEYTSGYSAKISELVAQMRENSNKWFTASSAEERNRLHQDSVQKANAIARLGVTAKYDENEGSWTIVSDKWNPSNVGRKLLSSYHTGGFAGVQPTLKQNEILAILEKGEAILDRQKEKGLYRLVEFATTLSDKFTELMKSTDMRQALVGTGSLTDAKADIPANISDSHAIRIEFGDTYITGTNDETVERHLAINRRQANELLAQLNIKR